MNDFRQPSPSSSHAGGLRRPLCAAARRACQRACRSRHLPEWLRPSAPRRPRTGPCSNRPSSRGQQRHLPHRECLSWLPYAALLCLSVALAVLSRCVHACLLCVLLNMPQQPRQQQVACTQRDCIQLLSLRLSLSWGSQSHSLSLRCRQPPAAETSFFGLDEDEQPAQPAAARPAAPRPPHGDLMQGFAEPGPADDLFGAPPAAAQPAARSTDSWDIFNTPSASAQVRLLGYHASLAGAHHCSAPAAAKRSQHLDFTLPVHAGIGAPLHATQLLQLTCACAGRLLCGSQLQQQVQQRLPGQPQQLIAWKPCSTPRCLSAKRKPSSSRLSGERCRGAQWPLSQTLQWLASLRCAR